MEGEKTTVSQKQISEILQFVAPGTPIRDGIDNVLRAKTGGLIVMGYNEQVKKMVDGGFSINCAFTPAHLYELAKMDGALILNDSAADARSLYPFFTDRNASPYSGARS